MATLTELRNVRLEKLEKLKNLGIDPYPARANKNVNNSQVVDKFETLENHDVTVAGRIISIRSHKNLVFIDIKDSTGKIQLYIKNDSLEKPNYKKSEFGIEEIELIDLGDFIEATGKVTKTQRGEISVEPSKLRLLVKTLRRKPSG